MAKTYTTNEVQSSMIWGSQYDAMLNFVLTGADKSKVTATTHGINGILGEMLTKTGTYTGLDCINNIYDLGGNKTEWTLEEYGTIHRSVRGGYPFVEPSPSSRDYWKPIYSDIRMSSRITLYIK